MAKNIFLLDLENVPAPRLGELAGQDCEVLVFVGENTTKLPRDLVLEVQKLGTKARYIEIRGSGRNALDFHIAYYLGEYAARKETSVFHVISKDTGFDPLIAHLKEDKGFAVSRSPSVEDTPLLRPDAAKTSASSVNRVDTIEARLRAHPKNRPQREATLASMIHSHFQKKLSDTAVKKLSSN